MNTGIDVKRIQGFGAFYIFAARMRNMSKWKVAIGAVDIGNPLFYLVSIGIGIVLLGTGAFVAWVLTLDSMETASASKERFKSKDHQQKH